MILQAAEITIRQVFVIYLFGIRIYFSLQIINNEIMPKGFKHYENYIEMSQCIRTPTICISENKDADQLCGNRKADQCLCFHYMDSTIPLLSLPEISNF